MDIFINANNVFEFVEQQQNRLRKRVDRNSRTFGSSRNNNNGGGGVSDGGGEHIKQQHTNTSQQKSNSHNWSNSSVSKAQQSVYCASMDSNRFAEYSEENSHADRLQNAMQELERDLKFIKFSANQQLTETSNDESMSARKEIAFSVLAAACCEGPKTLPPPPFHVPPPRGSPFALQHFEGPPNLPLYETSQGAVRAGALVSERDQSLVASRYNNYSIAIPASSENEAASLRSNLTSDSTLPSIGGSNSTVTTSASCFTHHPLQQDTYPTVVADDQSSVVCSNSAGGSSNPSQANVAGYDKIKEENNSNKRERKSSTSSTVIQSLIASQFTLVTPDVPSSLDTTSPSFALSSVSSAAVLSSLPKVVDSRILPMKDNADPCMSALPNAFDNTLDHKLPSSPHYKQQHHHNVAPNSPLPASDPHFTSLPPPPPPPSGPPLRPPPPSSVDPSELNPYHHMPPSSSTVVCVASCLPQYSGMMAQQQYHYQQHIQTMAGYSMQQPQYMDTLYHHQQQQGASPSHMMGYPTPPHYSQSPGASAYLPQQYHASYQNASNMYQRYIPYLPPPQHIGYHSGLHLGMQGPPAFMPQRLAAQTPGIVDCSPRGMEGFINALPPDNKLPNYLMEFLLDHKAALTNPNNLHLDQRNNPFSSNDRKYDNSDDCSSVASSSRDHRRGREKRHTHSNSHKLCLHKEQDTQSKANSRVLRNMNSVCAITPPQSPLKHSAKENVLDVTVDESVSSAGDDQSSVTSYKRRHHHRRHHHHKHHHNHHYRREKQESDRASVAGSCVSASDVSRSTNRLHDDNKENINSTATSSDSQRNAKEIVSLVDCEETKHSALGSSEDGKPNKHAAVGVAARRMMNPPQLVLARQVCANTS